VTVVCTDIVGSTRLADTLGDQKWRDLIGAHNAIVRTQLARHDGLEIKTSGDGFLVTFPSARRAVSFALDVHDAVRSLDLELRIGLHAGEVERDGTDIVGRNVSVACRLCDVAAPGEVLASAMVADLTDSSSDLAFGDDRELRLAGIERPVHARPASRRP
jgi:class 3 adenylate cyclase